jgi:hypothetical protein
LIGYRKPRAHDRLGARQAVLAVEAHIFQEELVAHQGLTTLTGGRDHP